MSEFSKYFEGFIFDEKLAKNLDGLVDQYNDFNNLESDIAKLNEQLESFVPGITNDEYELAFLKDKIKLAFKYKKTKREITREEKHDIGKLLEKIDNIKKLDVHSSFTPKVIRTILHLTAVRADGYKLISEIETEPDSFESELGDLNDSDSFLYKLMRELELRHLNGPNGKEAVKYFDFSYSSQDIIIKSAQLNPSALIENYKKNSRHLPPQTLEIALSSDPMLLKDCNIGFGAALDPSDKTVLITMLNELKVKNKDNQEFVKIADEKIKALENVKLKFRLEKGGNE